MDPPSWTELTVAVTTAAGRAAEMIGHPAVSDCWDLPSALADMSVGALAAHLGQMVGGLVAWLEAEPVPAGSMTVISLAQGYGTVARLDASAGLDGQVAQTIRNWGAQGAARGAPAVSQRCRADLGRLPRLLEGAAPDRLVPSAVIAGSAMHLDVYLRTRCVELVVHTDDLAHSVARPLPDPDPVALAVAVDTLTDMCRARVGDLEVLRALARPERAAAEALRAL